MNKKPLINRKMSKIDAEIIDECLEQGITDLTPFINQIKNNKMKEKTDQLNHNTQGLLKRYIEGIETYEDQKKEISSSIKEIFDEAKAAGFDVKTMRKIISMRKLDQAKLDEQEFLLETYKEALGMTQPDLFINQPEQDNE